jgi:hypothetical protein
MKLSTLGLACIFSFGCSQVQNAYDCDHICNRYSQCFDSSYDINACESRCKDTANDNETYASKAESCQSCEDDKSCAGATFSCIDECAGIVP